MFYWRWFNRPRHPLSRLLIGVLGAVLLVGILALGFFALVAFAIIGAIVALVRAFVKQAPRTAASGPAENVIEGEYVVLRHSAPIKR
jgi:hypothetical protein